jgi:hypothetical protein
MADVVRCSTALAFVTKISEKHKSKLPSAVQVKSWRKTVSIEGKLDVMS